jgi:hypothetical protein
MIDHKLQAPEIRVGDYVKILGGVEADRGRVFMVKAMEMDRVYYGQGRVMCALDERGRRYALYRLELVARKKSP